MLSFIPWLVSLSSHKQFTFSISGILIGLSFVNTYYILPSWGRDNQCDADDPAACGDAGRLSKVLLWLSAAIYAIGFFVAYALGPILTRLDQQ
jgi:mercuric ion transport protein